MHDFIVIGKGLMGVAAFKYCCRHSANTLLIGPDEPTNPANHSGVFGAHYDEARLTHLHGKSPVWGELGRRAISQYRAIEKESSIPFYYPVGELFVADDGVKSNYHNAGNIQNSRQKFDLALVELNHEERQKAFPYLSFPKESGVVWEKMPAGHINPRSLIKAQVAIGQKLGGRVVVEMALATKTVAAGVLVSTKSGREYKAKQVLVAAGAFSNGFELLPQKLPLTFKTEFILFGRVPASEAARLQNMPVIHYDLNSDTLADIYMVQPVRYPDGHYYIKMGANTHHDKALHNVPEMCAWYSGGDSDVMLDDMRAAVQAILPDLNVLAWHTDRCVITYTPQRMPIIDTIISGRLYVAVGGNGSSAYCSDAIGELAANLMINGEWQDGLDAGNFKPLSESPSPT